MKKIMWKLVSCTFQDTGEVHANALCDEEIKCISTRIASGQTSGTMMVDDEYKSYIGKTVSDFIEAYPGKAVELMLPGYTAFLRNNYALYSQNGIKFDGMRDCLHIPNQDVLNQSIKNIMYNTDRYFIMM